MDELKSFIVTMTIWNWIALIAFLIALMSGLNALLSLRARWRDWRGTKTKQKFDQRYKELERQVQNVAFYRKDGAQFYMWYLMEGARIIYILILVSFLFISAFVVSLSPFPKTIGLLFLILTYPLLVFAFNAASGLLDLTRNVRRPSTLVTRVNDFVAADGLKALLRKMILV